MLQCFVCSPIPKVSEKKWATGQSFIQKEITSYRIGTLISNNTKKSHCAIIYWAAAVAGAEPEIYWMAYKYITGEPPKLYREEGSPNSQVEEEVRNNYSWLNTRTYGKNAERLTLIWISRYLAQHSLNCLFLCTL